MLAKEEWVAKKKENWDTHDFRNEPAFSFERTPARNVRKQRQLALR
jgi:hypothetical protein